MVLIALPAGLAAQAIVEYSLGAAAVAGTAAAAQRLGRSAGDKLNRFGKSMPTPGPRTLRPLSESAPGTNPAAASASAPASRAAQPAAEQPATAQSSTLLLATAPAPPPAAAISYEDPAGIKEGMAYAEVVRRFGPPAMKLSSGTAGEETLCYSRSGRDLDVQLHDGKVASIHAPANSAGTLILR
jgi:hypothetical protein